MAPQSLELSRISKNFGQGDVLKGIDLSIRPGEFISLVGMSGCGKSTLLRIIAGLETPDQGRVHIGGQDMTDTDPAARNLAMVFQSYALYPHMTARWNIATPLRMRRLPFWARLPLAGMFAPRAALADIDASVKQAAETLQITELLDRKPSQLSGGQRQRVALARALVREPVAFLMDEPLSNLDAKLRAHMRDELAALHRRLGATFIYVTHDQVEAMSMSNRVALMSEGRIEQLGTPDELYQRPQTLTVARFIGMPSINLLPVDVAASGALTLFGQPLRITTRDEAGPATLAIRAEDFHPAKDGLSARVVRVERHGADSFVTCDFELDLNVTIIMRQKAGESGAANVGDALQLGFTANRAHLFGRDGKRRDLSVRERVAA